MKRSSANETVELQRILELIFNVSRQMRERVHELKQPAHLSMLHIGTLHYIAEQGSPLMTEVARHLYITRPSATSLINALVRSGHLQRLADSRDRRAVRLKLTAKGAKVVRVGFETVTRQIRAMIRRLSSSERQQFISILTKLTQVTK